MNKNIVRALFPDAVENVEENICPFCGKKVDEKEFKDPISKREFEISGLCQQCQDETFGI